MGWDLGALYRGEMSLREFRVRIRALPADSPLHAAMAQAQDEAAEAEANDAVADALTRYRQEVS